MGQNQLTNSNFMSQTDPDILRAKFNIPPDMTLNIYYVEDAGENIIENGFNYEEPPQTDKQHIQLMKQKFNIPPNMTVNTYYMGNSSDDINNAFNEPDNQVIYNPVPAPRMNFEFEDQISVPSSPIMSPISSTDEENEEDELEYEKVFGNSFSQEYLERSLPENLLIHQNNPQT